mgnify:CR=1 FL=1
MPFGNFKGYKLSKQGYLKPAKKGAPLNVRQKQSVKRIVGGLIETKFSTFQAAAQTFGCNSPALARIYIKDLTSIAQVAAGAAPTDTTRIGDRVTLTKIELRMQSEQRSFAGSQVGQANRIIIFQYKPVLATSALTNADADISTILAVGPSAAGTADYNSLSTYQHDTRNDYHILYDQTFSQVDNGDFSGIWSKVMRVPLKKAKKSISFIGGSLFGGYHIYIMVIGLAPELVNYFSMNARVYFKDA